MTQPDIISFEMQDGDRTHLVVILVTPERTVGAHVRLPDVLVGGERTVQVRSGELDVPGALTYRFLTRDTCDDASFRAFVLRVAARQAQPDDVLGGLLKRLIPF